MATTKVDKVIVTNRAALKAKYGATYTSKIKPAINALVAADKTRGIVTRLVLLDSATEMNKLGAPVVTKPASPKQNKQAIDGVFNALEPAYLCILGAVDIVPHQDLVNPIASDGDPLAPSDLPYACGAGYSKQINAFLQPTRVVGRLPDITGQAVPNYLTGLLKTAAAAQSLPASAFAAYLGISAKVWNGIDAAKPAEHVRQQHGHEGRPAGCAAVAADWPAFAFHQLPWRAGRSPILWPARQ